MKTVCTPDEMLPLLAAKNIENIFFKKFLRQLSSRLIDEHIHRFYKEVSAEVNCLACANCCKKLEPGLESHEIEALSLAANLEIEQFKHQYIAFDGEALYLKTKPCLFLKDCTCSVYEQRPAACAGYPHLDQQDMRYRKTLWDNYRICPIVFNVIERLKHQTGFQYPS